MHAEVRHDRIERAVPIWQILGVAFLHHDARVGGARNADHRGRKVQPLGDRAACDRGCGDIARPARDIEDAHAGRDSGGGEQWLDERSGCRCERVQIAGSGALPASVLERSHRLGLDAHDDAL
jgi:hypothetical protein